MAELELKFWMQDAVNAAKDVMVCGRSERTTCSRTRALSIPWRVALGPH
jgi:hypothetical protein